MAPVSDAEREGDGEVSLSREDCLCPICMEIFTEPVTLPCSHTFCKVCFLESVDKATLCCPLCRKRVAVWARHHGRNKTLVNETLWKRIQATFPRRQVQDDHDEPAFVRRLSEPGALRREYEDQLSQLMAERRAEDQQQLRASEELIHKLLADEERLQKERLERQEEDERLALVLSRELNSGLNQNLQPSPVTPPVRRLRGLERFLFPVFKGPAHGSLSNKEDVLSGPPSINCYGPHGSQSQPHEPHGDQSQPQETHGGQSQPQEAHGGQSQPQEAHGGQSQPQEPHSDQSQPQEAHGGQSQPQESHGSQSQPQEPHGSQSQPQEPHPRDGPAGGGTKRKIAEAELQDKRCCQLGGTMDRWERETQERRAQEEQDLKLALQLQRQLDQQQKRTDRRKGSADAYLLRTAPRRQTPPTTTSPPPAATAPPPHQERSASAEAPATMNSKLSPHPAKPRPQRQMTIKDLFNFHQIK